ncbi:MAG: hypothetical protein JNJ58_13725 [Chitinophagaceae bacterium]|nr:hypothetical protein [Chitinophagaceae bacterium]
MKLHLLLIAASLFLFTTCNIINPSEGIPTYIQIDSVQLKSTVPGTHGSVSHKITDVWVYYNREILGGFQLPARVPVLANGKGQLQILAGVWDNGLSGTRARYPFINVDTFTFNANPTQTITHIPQFTYRTADTPSIKYFIENFEQGNGFIKRSGDTAIVKTNIPGEVFEDDWSGKIELFDTITTSENISVQEYMLPPNKDCYMELNYKSDIPFVVRLQIYHVGTFIYSDVIGLNAKDKWNKIYINLTGFATSFQYGKFKIIIKSSLPAGKTSGKILLDNFKMIYFN